MQNFVFVRFFAKPGSEDKVKGILQNMVDNSRQEPGCMLYNLYEMSAEGKHIFCLAEQYRDDAALEAHRAGSYYKEYRATIMELLDGPIEVNILTPIDAV